MTVGGGTSADEPVTALAVLRAASLTRPVNAGRLARVAWGASLVPAVARALWLDHPLRRRYLVVLGVQLLIVVAAALGWLAFQGDLHRLSWSWRRVVRFALSLYATLVVTQWCVIALTRQFHDELSTRLARTVGVEPDDAVERPRLTFDAHWVFESLQRRVQAALVLVVSALPPLLLLGVIVMGPTRWLSRHDDGAARFLAVAAQWTIAQLPNALVLACSAYWFAVLAVGRSGHAWRDAAAPSWSPLRWAEAGSARRPALYGPLRLWARAVARVMGVMNRPAAIVEHAPWETLGLALVQLAASVPGVRLLLRPLVPVAATVIIEAARDPPRA